jgi:hypothetical protein
MSQQETNSFSSDFSYLFFRNGASFRINYDDQNENDLNNPSHVSKLTDLCCSIIVRNEYLIEQACDSVPKELFNHLFRAALCYTQDDTCINTLISRWPYRVLRLEDFVDEKLTSLKMLLCEKTALQRTKQSIKYSVIIIPRFIDSIRQQQQQMTEKKLSNLCILDVTNFPVVELIIRYISTHCRLAEKESRRNQLIDIYKQQHHQLLPDSKLNNENTKGKKRNSFERNISTSSDIHSVNSHDNNDDLIKSNSYPDDTIIIRFDCIIQDYRTYVELLSALRSSTPNIQLQICTIDMRCIGLALVSSFLDHVDKRVNHFLFFDISKRQNI